MWLDYRLRTCIVGLPALVIATFVISYLISRANTPDEHTRVKYQPPRANVMQNSPKESYSIEGPRVPQSNPVIQLQVDTTNTIPANVSLGFPQKPRPFPNPAFSQKNAGSLEGRALDYEFVVSHYDEDLQWLRPYAKNAHVYEKGNGKAPPFDVYKWDKIANVGREAHTYLYHILANYDNLANITVFLQGHGPARDAPWCFPQPMDFVHNAQNNHFCKQRGIYRGWGRINHFGKWLAALNTGAMRRASHTVGEFYAAVFAAKHPASVTRCLAGCFAGTRENLRRHPLNFYKKAISFLDDHSNPEEAHYMERLWAAIVNA